MGSACAVEGVWWAVVGGTRLRFLHAIVAAKKVVSASICSLFVAYRTSDSDCTVVDEEVY